MTRLCVIIILSHKFGDYRASTSHSAQIFTAIYIWFWVYSKMLMWIYIRTTDRKRLRNKKKRKNLDDTISKMTSQRLIAPSSFIRTFYLYFKIQFFSQDDLTRWRDALLRSIVKTNKKHMYCNTYTNPMNERSSSFINKDNLYLFVLIFMYTFNYLSDFKLIIKSKYLWINEWHVRWIMCLH